MLSLIMFYILAIVGFSGILMLADAYIGYRRGVTGKEPEGISGFRRAIMALTVILIIGIAMFHLLVVGKVHTIEYLFILNMEGSHHRVP